MIVARHEVPPEGPAPQELQDSGFNLGNPQNKRFALTRRYLVAPCEGASLLVDDSQG
jgi:hypothetical protein